MTAQERNQATRAKLHAAHTCGVEFNDAGVKAASGRQWCVRCGVALSNKRARTHRERRCWTFETNQPSGCQRIIVTRPRVVAPRAKTAPDPIKKLRTKRDAAEKALAQWDRKLALAMTKVRQYRTSVRRSTATLETALNAARSAGPGKTRRIEVLE